MKNLFFWLVTILLSIIFPPAGIVLIIYGIYSIFKDKNDNNHVKQDGKKYIHINNVKMDSPNAQKCFDWYKKILLEEKFGWEEVSTNIDLRREYNNIKKIEDSLPENNDESYVFALNTEFMMCGNDVAPNDIILNPQEEVYFKSQLSAIDTVQKISRDIAYSGIRMSEGILRIGGGTIYSRNVEGLKRFDAGTILVTNQRIIFKGTRKNKTIAIGNILSIDDFEDNGVIISMSNRENPIVIRFLADKCFFYNEIHDIRLFYNDVNWFYKALEKSLYKRFVPKDVQEMRKEMDSINFTLARNAMLAEGLEKEN